MEKESKAFYNDYTSSFMYLVFDGIFNPEKSGNKLQEVILKLNIKKIEKEICYKDISFSSNSKKIKIIMLLLHLQEVIDSKKKEDFRKLGKAVKKMNLNQLFYDILSKSLLDLIYSAISKVIKTNHKQHLTMESMLSLKNLTSNEDFIAAFTYCTEKKQSIFLNTTSIWYIKFLLSYQYLFKTKFLEHTDKKQNNIFHLIATQNNLDLLNHFIKILPRARLQELCTQKNILGEVPMHIALSSNNYLMSFYLMFINNDISLKNLGNVSIKDYLTYTKNELFMNMSKKSVISIEDLLKIKDKNERTFPFLLIERNPPEFRIFIDKFKFNIEEKDIFENNLLHVLADNNLLYDFNFFCEKFKQNYKLKTLLLQKNLQNKTPLDIIKEKCPVLAITALLSYVKKPNHILEFKIKGDNLIHYLVKIMEIELLKKVIKTVPRNILLTLLKQKNFLNETAIDIINIKNIRELKHLFKDFIQKDVKIFKIFKLLRDKKEEEASALLQSKPKPNLLLFSRGESILHVVAKENLQTTFKIMTKEFTKETLNIFKICKKEGFLCPIQIAKKSNFKSLETSFKSFLEQSPKAKSCPSSPRKKTVLNHLF